MVGINLKKQTNKKTNCRSPVDGLFCWIVLPWPLFPSFLKLIAGSGFLFLVCPLSLPWLSCEAQLLGFNESLQAVWNLSFLMLLFGRSIHVL